jgi:hypothetical protein
MHFLPPAVCRSTYLIVRSPAFGPVKIEVDPENETVG